MSVSSPPTTQQFNLGFTGQKPPHAAPDVPPELVSVITEYVKALPRNDGTTWERDIASFRLVSRTFEGVCRSVLYNAVIINVGPYSSHKRGSGKPIKKAKRLASILYDRPRLADVIENVTFRFVGGRPFGWLDDRALLEVLNRLSAVRMVCLEGPSSERRLQAFEMDHEEESAVEKAVFSILEKEQMKKLVLRNVKISAFVLAKCVGLEDLESYHSNWWVYETDIIAKDPLASDENAIRYITPSCDQPIRPKRLLYTGRYSLNDMVLESCPGILPLSWSRLEVLSLPDQDPGELFMDIMRNATRLRIISLELSKSSPFKPWEPTDPPFPPYPSPLKDLNPSSFATLTDITLNITFDVGFPYEVINDPYCGLLNDGIFQKLISLQRLLVHVCIQGYELNMLGGETFGSQWSKLDDALVPHGQEMVHQQLRKVEVTCEVEDQVHWGDIEKMFQDNFVGLRKLESGGRIRLLLKRLDGPTRDSGSDSE